MSAPTLTNSQPHAGKTTHPRAREVRLGAHVSVAGGLEKAIAAGERVGCDCLQIFVKNQRRWHAPKLADEQVSAFQASRRESRISPIIAHASYLLNLASPDRARRWQSVKALTDELQRCEALGVQSLVLHPGAHLTATPAEGIRRVAASLNKVHQATLGYRTKILLETTAGQGTSIGYKFEHIATILDRTRHPQRLGVCLDTCHLFAAGYDFRTVAAYETMLKALNSIIGVANVRCIHLNDSKRELGSRVDRHEHIGKGKIGKRGFAHFLNDPNFAGIPMILETPKGVDGRGCDLDKVNLKRLRSLIV